MSNQLAELTYWQLVKTKFSKNRMAVWSLRLFMGMLFITIFADFLANEKPIVCKIEGHWSAPIFEQYAINIGWSEQTSEFRLKEWLKEDYEFSIFPPITYSATYQDRRKNRFVSPFEKQNIFHWRFRHWLGTDKLGRDVAAGMIAGTRTAILVGLTAMSIASLLGIFFGAVAGFFGDDRFKTHPLPIVLLLIGLFLGVFWGFISRSYLLQHTVGSQLFEFLKSFLILIATPTICFGLGKLVLRLFPQIGQRQIVIPLDLIIMRIIEIFNSIPGLLLILAVVAVVKKPSVFYVMVLLGLIGWTGIARFIRGELLKIRNLAYIEAARAIGMREWRILLYQAIPNAITPVLITISFGIAGAILAEAGLSFLGIGVAPESVTWGSMLKSARETYSNNGWWLALFPGLAIFITVTILNLIGEGLSESV